MCDHVAPFSFIIQLDQYHPQSSILTGQHSTRVPRNNQDDLLKLSSGSQSAGR